MKVMLEEGAFMPERAYPTDAGLDLFCTQDTILWAGEAELLDTGVHIELPPGYYAEVKSKSGLNVNCNIVSAGTGVIDEGYTGSIAVKLYNFGRQSHRFHRGDKIAQLVIMPYLAPDLELVDKLDETARGSNGFGSTGK